MSKNSTMLFKLAVLSSMGLLITGCNEAKSEKKKSFSTAQANLLEAEGKTEDAAEMYSRMGEILLTRPEGVTHAQTMFKKALELNKQDGKANIYSAVLSPFLTTKGFVARIPEPTDAIEKAELDALKLKIKNTNVKEFIDFALVAPKGKHSISTVEDIRKFLRNEYIKELDASLVNLGNVKAEKTVLSYIDLYGKTSKAVSSDSISGNLSNADLDRVIEQNSLITNKQMNIDAYDLKALKILFKTQKNALTIATSIGLTGFEEISAQTQKSSGATDKEIIAAIKMQPNLLK